MDKYKNSRCAGHPTLEKPQHCSSMRIVMIDAEFRRAVKAARLKGRSLAACRLVLVEGLTAYAAAQKTGVNKSSVSRMLAKIPTKLCPRCGQPVTA